MKKYKRIEMIVEADQYWAMKKMDLPGFRNIIEKVLVPGTMEYKTICESGEFTVDGIQVPLDPGDYIIKTPDGRHIVKKFHEFSSEFVEIK